MYHTKNKNQQIKKSFNSKSLSLKKLHSEQFSPKEHAIYSAILKCNKKDIPNGYLADRANCSIKTVTRATNKFHRMGIIFKYQTHKYDFNRYVILNTHVPPKNTLSSLLTLSRNFLNFFKNLSPWTRARAKGSSQKKGDKMNAVQKKLILDNKNDPKIKEVINNPKVKSEIITPTIEKLSKLLSLDENEYYKLTAFPEEALQSAFEYIEPIVQGTKVIHIAVTNKLEWLIDVASRYCKKHNITPDWGWYYDLCRIVGIDTQTDPKPLDIQKPKTKTPKKGKIYSPWRSPDTSLSRDDLVKEIESCKLKLADPSKYFKFCVNEGIKYTQKKLEEYVSELNELDKEHSNEEQSVLYSSSTHFMAASGA